MSERFFVAFIAPRDRREAGLTARNAAKFRCAFCASFIFACVVDKSNYSDALVNFLTNVPD
ncbi:MAG TPA: hypothetical protein VER76_07595 [Pyrinomonadaceae bacterium]|nr:hypothetical protein [Pyrinomonadaceae bacterium]